MLSQLFKKQYGWNQTNISWESITQLKTVLFIQVEIFWFMWSPNLLSIYSNLPGPELGCHPLLKSQQE